MSPRLAWARAASAATCKLSPSVKMIAAEMPRWLKNVASAWRTSLASVWLNAPAPAFINATTRRTAVVWGCGLWAMSRAGAWTIGAFLRRLLAASEPSSVLGCRGRAVKPLHTLSSALRLSWGLKAVRKHEIRRGDDL